MYLLQSHRHMVVFAHTCVQSSVDSLGNQNTEHIMMPFSDQCRSAWVVGKSHEPATRLGGGATGQTPKPNSVRRARTLQRQLYECYIVIVGCTCYSLQDIQICVLGASVLKGKLYLHQVTLILFI